MQDFLILKLKGVMQAWGGHTFEDYRPSHPFPTRSALIGLIGACLGIQRDETARMQNLSTSFTFAVRSDTAPVKITDYHTILGARKVDGKANKNPVQSYREYLCDACFTVAMRFSDTAPVTLNSVTHAIQKPFYTPFLGRRSCPLTRPLYERVLKADTLIDALKQIEPYSGTVYSETETPQAAKMLVRDVPMTSEHRQFSTRSVYIIPMEKNDVFEQNSHPSTVSEKSV